MEPESDSDTNCNWCAQNNYKGILQGLEDLGIRGWVGDHPNYSIIEIGQNSKKSPGDLRRLAVTQIPVENHQLMVVWKTIKWVKS